MRTLQIPPPTTSHFATRGHSMLTIMTSHSIFPQIRLAASYGMVGVLLYADPADSGSHHQSLCHQGALYSNANDDGTGDPLTPDFPASGTVILCFSL